VHREYRASASEEISRGIAAGDTLRAIARGLHRAVSTVSQELARHGGREGYRAAHADQMAWDSARRPKPCVLARSPRLQWIVAGKLKQDWSPQQIAGWLRDQYPESPEMWVSHETIYRSLFIQARGALKKTSSATFQSQHPPPSPCRRRACGREDSRCSPERNSEQLTEEVSNY
jgi:IS30 family transposase